MSRQPLEPAPATLFRAGRLPRFVLFDARGRTVPPEATKTVWISPADLPALDEFLQQWLGVIAQDRAVPDGDLAWAVGRALYAHAEVIAGGQGGGLPMASGGIRAVAALETVAAAAATLALRGPEGVAALLLSFGDTYEEAAHATERALYAIGLAVTAGIAQRHELAAIVVAGLFADAGKTALLEERLPGQAEGLLDLDGPLDAEGQALMRRHPLRSLQAMRRFGIGSLLAQRAVRGHHERWDGRGYPDSLGGDNIPREARILAVADAFTALTVERSFSPRRTAFEAVREMSAAAGQFDPRLVRCFIVLLGGGEAVRRPDAARPDGAERVA